MSQYSCHGGLQRLTNVWHGTIPDQTIPHQITFVLPTSRLLLVCVYATLAGKPTHPTTKAKQNYARPPKLHQKISMPSHIIAFKDWTSRQWKQITSSPSKTGPVDSGSRSHHRLQKKTGDGRVQLLKSLI